jgi:hypothetical protein
VISKSTAIPGAITGPAAGVCALGTAAYSIAPVTGATGYNWYTPAGMYVISGAGTTSIMVNSAATVSGTLKVNSQNTCGSSAASSLAISCADPIAMSSAPDTKKNIFTLYPNPATNEFTITGINNQSSITNTQLIMIDVLGKIVMQSTITNNQSTITINQLKSGIYFVRLIDMDNNAVYTGKVVKE